MAPMIRGAHVAPNPAMSKPLSVDPVDPVDAVAAAHATDAARRVKLLARWLDEAVRVPGTNTRVGLDALIGLLPVGGDLAGALLAGSALFIAARAGAPSSVLVRMAGNIAIDALGGTIPLLGDLFDVTWRANSRNARLLEAWADSPAGTQRASTGLIVGLVVVLVLIIAGSVMIALALFRALISLFQMH